MKILGWLKQKRYIILALFIYTITCIALYMVEYRVYEDAIDTNFFSLCIILPISFFVGWLSRDKDKPTEEKEPTIWTKIGTICFNLILILFILYFIHRIYKNIYELVPYLCLTLLLLLAIMHFFIKLERANEFNAISVSLIYVTLLVTTLLYNIILHPFTVKDATLKIHNYGFSDISYRSNIKDKETLSSILGKEINETLKYEENLGYYLFKGEQDEKDYVIFISVTKGTIVTIEEVTDNNSFYHLLN